MTPIKREIERHYYMKNGKLIMINQRSDAHDQKVHGKWIHVYDDEDEDAYLHLSLSDLSLMDSVVTQLFDIDMKYLKHLPSGFNTVVKIYYYRKYIGCNRLTHWYQRWKNILVSINLPEECNE